MSSVVTPALTLTLAKDRLAHARAVKGRVAPRGAERPGALHPHVQIVLDRVADGAVALERDARREGSRVGGGGLGHRHVKAGVALTARDRVRGAMHDGARELELHERAREVVLHSLK